MPKLIIHDVLITSRSIDIPKKCPHCEHKLTSPNSLSESRLCSTIANTHVSDDADDALSETDSADSEVTYKATLSVECSNCGTIIAHGKLSESCADPE
jgi:hypothetical protein